MKIKSWNPKKEKKARFKRKLARLKKRGGHVYGGYYELEEVDALEYLDIRSIADELLKKGNFFRE